MIRSMERLDIDTARLTGSLEIFPAPCEPLAAEVYHKDIGGKTRPSSIAVRKRMDGDETMVEADRSLIA